MSSAPKYAPVKDAIIRRIAKGDLRPGDRAGSESVLARKHGVSKFTVIKAFTELVNERVLSRSQGRGTFVTEEAPAVVRRLTGTRCVRLLSPFRAVNRTLIEPALGRFAGRFGAKAVEFTDRRDDADVILTTAGLGPAGAAALLPLDRFVTASELAARYDTDVLDLFRRGGSLYALPRDHSPAMLHYNADLFAERGIAPPDDSWTWETLSEAARKLTDRPRGLFGYAAGRGMIFAAPFLLQSGARVFDESGRCALDSPEAVAALRFCRDLERISPLSEGAITYETILDAFAEGRIAMIVWGGPLGAILKAGAKFRWGVASAPKGRIRATTRFADGAAVSKKSRDPELAWELVQCLASSRSQEELVERGHLLPATRDVAAVGSVAEAMRRDLPISSAPGAIEDAAAYRVASDQIVRCWDRFGDAAEFAREVARRVNLYIELRESDEFEGATP